MQTRQQRDAVINHTRTAAKIEPVRCLENAGSITRRFSITPRISSSSDRTAIEGFLGH